MRRRVRLAIRGAVQGVGFRPFVYRLAVGRGVGGWVRNAVAGVFVEAEGDGELLRAFVEDLRGSPPPRAVIHSLEASWLDPAGYEGFAILESDQAGEPAAVVLPDIATCAACRREIFDPADRRYRYPFTNCTNCGPRFSIIERMPYDRANTSMRTFAMCQACASEYRNPADRRFHAQPNACPACGPRLELWDRSGAILDVADAALRRAVEALRHGQVVAVKGLGGFHLVTDASDEAAVRRLRVRKHREEKPFALMCPSLEAVAHICDVGASEAQLLASPEAPIALLARRGREEAIALSAVAPGSPSLGVMLPYTPLHHLLLADFGRPIVATSGNLAEEPIAIDEREALARLGDIADVFLVHNRPIVRHVDDSIVRLLLGRELVMRRARGYAPLPLPVGLPARPTLAVGAHLKNTVAVSTPAGIAVSQHIGDLETQQSTEAFHRVIGDLQRLLRIVPEVVVADDHPDYLSTKHAQGLGLPVVRVQHHVAHVAACMAENDLAAPLVGVSWDGTGYGVDGTVWGGEFLHVGSNGWDRVASLRPFRLPGGERAVREPRRSALGLAMAAEGPGARALRDAAESAFTPVELQALCRAVERGVNAPVTTSMGRLFDAAAALSRLALHSTYEGQAAVALEWAFDESASGVYPFEVHEDGPRWSASMRGWRPPALVVDWQPGVEALVRDAAGGVEPGIISARFHRMLASAIVRVAERLGEPIVVLTGGCFQNRRLTELSVAALGRAGFRAYWHQRLPPNDGGISAGQLAAWALGLDGPPRSARQGAERVVDEVNAAST